MRDYRQDVLWYVRMPKGSSIEGGRYSRTDTKLYQLYCSRLLKQAPVNYVIRTTYYTDSCTKLGASG